MVDNPSEAGNRAQIKGPCGYDKRTGLPYRPVAWQDGRVYMIDQRFIPSDIVILEHNDYREVIESIGSMVVRGAPAIGVAAAMGVALGAHRRAGREAEEFRAALGRICDEMAQARPTAVSLSVVVERMRRVACREGLGGARERADAMVREAEAISDAQVEIDRAIGEHGASLIESPGTVITHCNAGPLATGGIGTAIGVISTAFAQGKVKSVFADETRPYLQGARLTAWELMQQEIPCTLITDSMAGHLMSRGRIDHVVVGADRIAANGDTANKIGTYPLAVLAKEHGIPFYVAAPLDTIDPNCPGGEDIPIEERDPEDITSFMGRRVAPSGCVAEYPSFDVTPAKIISAIITEKGNIRQPLAEGIKEYLDKA